jgi:hypothetical protein
VWSEAPWGLGSGRLKPGRPCEDRVFPVLAPTSASQVTSRGRHFLTLEFLFFEVDSAHICQRHKLAPYDRAYSTAGAFCAKEGAGEAHLCRNCAGTEDNCGLHGTTDPRHKSDSHKVIVVRSCPACTPPLGLRILSRKGSGFDSRREERRAPHTAPHCKHTGSPLTGQWRARGGVKWLASTARAGRPDIRGPTCAD